MKETRSKKITELSNEYGSKILSDYHKNIYLERLKIELPLKSTIQKNYFDQYEQGDGKELKTHFWSTKSSSRLCFEFFSWLAYEDGVKEVVFEKKLPGINHSPKIPNMDVYIHKENNYYFIESKLTEYGNNIYSLPDSYFKEKGEAFSTSGKPINSSLSDRYYNTGFDKSVMNLYESIIKKLKENNTRQKPSWLDIPQEIKHTIGIYFEIINNINKYNNNCISFYNLFYDFKDGNDDFAKFFFDIVQSIMRKELKKKGFNGTYIYSYVTYQEAVKLIPERPAFGSDKIPEMNGSTNKNLINSFLGHRPIKW
ncbi:MAG: hypothetical protein K5765_01780 [Clostridia bacterium]|nr:hypothetical protein [Clostridia bacterium]